MNNTREQNPGLTKRQLVETEPASFQSRVAPWMEACFGPRISADTSERNHRFIEEALELVQAGGMPREDAHALVDYVYNRPVGDPPQEVGGVMVTLAALCLATGLDMHHAAETELERVWGKIEQIREKQASKPRNSPLPEYVGCPQLADPVPSQGDEREASSMDDWWPEGTILEKALNKRAALDTRTAGETNHD